MGRSPIEVLVDRACGIEVDAGAARERPTAPPVAAPDPVLEARQVNALMALASAAVAWKKSRDRGGKLAWHEARLERAVSRYTELGGW